MRWIWPCWTAGFGGNWLMIFRCDVFLLFICLKANYQSPYNFRDLFIYSCILTRVNVSQLIFLKTNIYDVIYYLY